MQVNNDYQSYQNRDYQKQHRHHVTECLYEEENKKREGSLGGIKTQASNRKAQAVKKEVELGSFGGNAEGIKGTEKKKTGLMKGLWEALGEEDSQDLGKVTAVWKENILSGIYGAASSFQTAFAHRIVNKWEYVRDRIKTGASAALRKFGKNREAFTALSDERTPSHRKNAGTKEEKQKGQVTTKRKEEEMIMKNLSHDHLMDSYSKTGEYCQINENLTYQKPRAFQGEKDKGTAVRGFLP